MAPTPTPTYVKHRVYYDGFEDYRCAYRKMLTRNAPALNEVLTFRLVRNAWVLIWERDFCTTTDFPEMIERFEHATGIRAERIEYAYRHDTAVVLEAERLAEAEREFIDAVIVIDLAPDVGVVQLNA